MTSENYKEKRPPSWVVFFYCPPPKSDENKEYPKESKTAIV